MLISRSGFMRRVRFQSRRPKEIRGHLRGRAGAVGHGATSRGYRVKAPTAFPVARPGENRFR
ncbi:hypothetical protein IPC692_13100 [Pseudomonas aeruginosa]|nr:hypothetical protein IPC692_13100 [Pseudomonas aeruginosa]RPY41905.1 hypothetical protein IPC688_27935 [Pseudomonas aeruginosa]